MRRSSSQRDKSADIPLYRQTLLGIQRVQIEYEDRNREDRTTFATREAN